MIDEELYQQASDELSSERRQEHIWTRACALSNNDHDEARYLYTNLRVEELIAARESGANPYPDASTDNQNAAVMDSAVSGTSTGTVQADDINDLDEDSTLSMDDVQSLVDDSDLQLDNDPLMQNIDLSSEPLASVEREYYERHPEQLKELQELKELEESTYEDSLNTDDEELDVLLSGINNANYNLDDAGALTADFRDATSTQAVMVDHEMDWLDSDQPDDTKTGLQRITSNGSQIPQESDTDRFTQDLLRQVDDLPGQHSDVVASEEPNLEESTWEPSPMANGAVVGTAAAIGAARYGQAPESSQTRRSTHTSKASQLPIDLTEGNSGTEYTIFRKNNKVQVVKKGVSWSALFFTTPYLIYRHLFGTAIVYTIMSLIVVAGLIFMGLSWLNAGDAASNLVKYSTLGFGLLAIIGLLYIPFRDGNSWRSDKLERRGFELVARVKAKNPGKAVALARRASALD